MADGRTRCEKRSSACWGRFGRNAFGSRFALTPLVLLLFAAATPAADPDSVSQDIPATAGWNLDVVRLKDGNVYRGLVQAEEEQLVEFAEIVRPPGKPMHAVIRPLARIEIAQLEKVPDSQRQQLVRRFNAFRHRARIESERMNDLVLQLKTTSAGQLLSDGPQSQPRREWIYEGPWFHARSTSDEVTTRRCIVRIEQMFRAYRQLLPPRTRPDPASGSLVILLFGSMDEYHQYLHDRMLDIRTSAFYSARYNTIVAGSELARYSQRLEAMEQKNERRRQQYERLNDAFRERFAERAARMKESGFSRDEIKFERQVRLATWKREYRTMLDKLDQNHRNNESKFSLVAQDMFTRLYHEAFHAYLENYVFPRRQYRVPRWFNEGLAQVFESGRLDGDVLRVDAPDAEKLNRLQEDLRSGGLPLSQILSAQHDSFLVTHSQDASYRHYLYAWGLAYYLAFNFNSPTPKDGEAADPGPQAGAAFRRLARFVQPTRAERPSAIKQFEAWTGQPLEQFESEWRAAMLREQ